MRYEDCTGDCEVCPLDVQVCLSSLPRDCYLGCATCSDYGQTLCTTCSDDYFYLNHECLQTCPYNYYND